MEVSLHFGGVWRCGGAVTERGDIFFLLDTVFAHFNMPLDIYESSSPYVSHHFFDLVWVTLNERREKNPRKHQFWEDNSQQLQTARVSIHHDSRRFVGLVSKYPNRLWRPLDRFGGFSS
jgi:hypothetical protein